MTDLNQRLSRTGGQLAALIADTQRAADLMRQLNRYERRIGIMVLERLVLGRRKYGPLAPQPDGRDWRREEGEECADGIVYRLVPEMYRRILNEDEQRRRGGFWQRFMRRF